MTVHYLRRFTVALFGLALLLMLVCAVGAIFVDDRRMDELMGTGALTLLWVCVRQMDKPSTRYAGMASMATFTLAWVMFLLTIWTDELPFLPRSLFEQTGLSGVAVLVCWPGLYGGGLWLGAERGRLAGHILLWGSCVVLGAWLFAIWGSLLRTDTAANVMGAMAITTVFTALAALQSGWHLNLRRLGAGLTVVGAAMWVVLAIENVSPPDAIIRVDLAIGCLAAGGMLGWSNLLMLVDMPTMRWLRTLTMTLGILTLALLAGLLTTSMATSQWSNVSEVLARCMVAAGLLTLASGLTMGIVAHRCRTFTEQHHDTEVGISCPRCRKDLVLNQGEGRCPHCALRMRFTCEPPVCRVCEYVLAPTFPGRCPECGTSVLLEPAFET